MIIYLWVNFGVWLLYLAADPPAGLLFQLVFDLTPASGQALSTLPDKLWIMARNNSNNAIYAHWEIKIPPSLLLF